MSKPWVVVPTVRNATGAIVPRPAVRALYTRPAAERRAAQLTSSFGPQVQYVAREATEAEQGVYQWDERYSERQEPDYGDAFDGYTVTSDADPGL